VHSIFVSVGTDHHPFDRMVEWADSWAAEHPNAAIFVQYGFSRPPRHACGAPQIAHSELVERIRAADVVVTQAGPGGITDARECGKLPIVFPRNPAFGEHVDDHQLRFAAHQAGHGRIALATGPVEVSEQVGRALRFPAEYLAPRTDSPTAATARAVGRVVQDVLNHRTVRLRGR
jgi:UDP-N-acetylglucosamine transferase subunit ALG13